MNSGNSDLKKRSMEIEALLSPWKGMTIREARENGWNDEHDALQAELWSIGFKQTHPAGG